MEDLEHWLARFQDELAEQDAPVAPNLIVHKTNSRLADDLALMGPGSVLVNTSRAGLIAPGALKAALDAGRPGKAAIDVFDEEPITWTDDPLATHPRLVATPHIGFVTEDELEIQFADIFDQVVAWRDGAPIHMINPEAWDRR